ncbi:hypothetical protein NON20_08135 [Synechocystis sp. B12]|nr:hypothetical protein NON20_08135 [Synechocystis sp. B12]
MGSPEFSPNVTSLTTKPPKRSRHRKRPKRRPIHCPIHGCYLDSVSQKHGLYADQIAQLRSRGYTHKKRVLSLAIAPPSALPGNG